MKRISLCISLAAAAAGCTIDPGLKGVPQVREATAAEVGACVYVSDFRSTPAVYGVLASQGVQYSRNKIKQGAMESGANTVVFDPVAPGAPVYEVHAVAYRC